MLRLIKYLSPLFFLLFCSNALAGLSVAQSANANGGNPAATFSSSVASGSVIFAIVTSSGWSGQDPTVSDNVNSGNYSQLGCYDNASYSEVVCEFWIVANNTGTPTVTVNYGGWYATVYIGQITGFTGTPQADTSIVADFSGSSTTISVSPATSKYNNEVMLIGLANNQYGAGGGSGWNGLSGCPGSYNCLADYAVESTAGTNDNFSETLGASSNWIALLGGIYDSGSISGPTTPTNLSAVAVGSAQINLTWTASTGGVGAISYNVQRCSGAGCANFTLIGNSTSAAYNDTGLSSSTSYSYQVQAVDLHGDLSGFSGTASATTSGSGGGGCAASATNTFTYSYNSLGQLQSISTTAGCTAQYTYDSNGNLINVQVTP